MSLTALETITLEDGDARVVIAPARGGMVTRFDVGEEPVLFLDAASLADTTKNVRGGIPVLFPSPGPLAGERFSREGKSGSMKQHGFARQEAWAVVGHTERDVTLELESNDATRAQFPWDFSALLHYTLADTKLTIEMLVRNTSTTPLPFAFGLHPYFHVPDAEKAQARIETDATLGFDNVTKKMVDVRGPIDLTQKEVDLHLVDHKPDTATLRRARDSIVVTADADVGDFGRWVVWTLAGKDFVCLEPWTAPADALNTGDRLLNVLPTYAATLSVTIACVKRA
jgi:galactose mutarotase-like enzyme